jgi:phosphoenolpyruvate carboxylase
MNPKEPKFPKIPKTLSTQHPDNVNTPFFAHNSVLSGEDEIQEAFYAYSHLGIEEQMWDVEGKEVDPYVVKKLLSKYDSYFRKHQLGLDKRLILRVPNPEVERAEAKVLLETLESIPRSFDAAALFYQNGVAPIFEVILPLTSSADQLLRVHRYYHQFVSGKGQHILDDQGTTLKAWIGDFKPDTVQVIPLFEDKASMLNAKAILNAYFDGLGTHRPSHQRVFFARSDPAMNYGFVSAILLNKLALQAMRELEAETTIKLYPIIGVGSAPFRGHLTPARVSAVLSEYPSVHTFTLQSAFKYDYDVDEVIKAVKTLQAAQTSSAMSLDETRSLELIERYGAAYERHVLANEERINRLAKYVPARRLRKLHIGLFGYARNLKGTSLPRVITFTAALYSLGCPPELFGLEALRVDDLSFVRQHIVNFDDDIRSALRYFNPATPCASPELRHFIETHYPDVKADPNHLKLTQFIIDKMDRYQHHDLEDLIQQAASFRHFLG